MRRKERRKEVVVDIEAVRKKLSVKHRKKLHLAIKGNLERDGVLDDVCMYVCMYVRTYHPNREGNAR